MTGHSRTPETGVRRVLSALDPSVGRTRGEWATDIVLFVIALVSWFLSGNPEASPQIPHWWWPWDLALGLIGCAAMWWTRRYPLLIAIIMIVPGSLSMTSGFTALFAVYRAGLLARPSAALLVTLAHIAFALPYHVVLPVPGVQWLAWVIVIPLLYALALCIGLLTRARRQVIVGLREAAMRDRQRYEENLASTRREERERIAREMHDVLAHRISLLSVHAGALEYRASSPQPLTLDETRFAAGVIRENAHLAVEDLRELLSLLRDDGTLQTASAQPRLADLDALIAEAEAAGQRVQLSMTLDTTAVRETVQRTVYRIVQEALTNARKHAPQSRVRASIAAADGRVLVEIANPVAVGITALDIPESGAGLIGLAERVRIDDGTFSAGVVEGQFRVSADLPGGS